MKETLQILNCGFNCGIDQDAILELKLINLNAYHNDKIKNARSPRRA